jgi:c-di-GMP-binding flagellar brake protein YcgR
MLRLREEREVLIMNRRMHPRVDLVDHDIKVHIATPDHAFLKGTVRDISKSGISFFTKEENGIEHLEEIEIIFIIKEQLFVFEVEVIRIEKDGKETLRAGRFKGVPAIVIKEQFPFLVHHLTEQLVLS